ncbi:MAG: hypothetical protein ACI30P_07635 [Muribaculaceae bacterium]
MILQIYDICANRHPAADVFAIRKLLFWKQLIEKMKRTLSLFLCVAACALAFAAEPADKIKLPGSAFCNRGGQKPGQPERLRPLRLSVRLSRELAG